MAPGIQAVVSAAQAWLRSSWQVQVPFAWLEACVEWLQGEAGGAAHLSQQQINQQVGRVCESGCVSQCTVIMHWIPFLLVSGTFFLIVFLVDIFAFIVS